MEIGFNLDLDIAAKASQGGRIGTGVYKVEIVKAYVYKTEKGNNLIDLELRSENGEVGFVNRLCIDQNWVSGAENFDYPKWMELAAAAGMKTLTTIEAKRKTAEGEVDAVMIKELIGKVVKMAVYEEFDVYNNKEKISLKIANTFLADGRSIAEAQSKKPATKITKIESRLTPHYTEDWKAWKANGGVGPVTDENCDTMVESSETQDDDDEDLFG